MAPGGPTFHRRPLIILPGRDAKGAMNIKMAAQWGDGGTSLLPDQGFPSRIKDIWSLEFYRVGHLRSPLDTIGHHQTGFLRAGPPPLKRSRAASARLRVSSLEFQVPP